MDVNDNTYEVVQEYLDSVNEQLEYKVENIWRFIRNLEADAKMYKEEKDRLAKKQKSAENKVKSLKEYLSLTLNQLGYDHKNKKKIKTAIGNVVFRKSPMTVEILEPDKVPEQFIKPVEKDFYKKEIVKWLKENKDDINKVDELILEDLGLKVINNKSSLQCR